MDYRIGLDIGIGSIGWAVVAGKFGEGYIEDFGVRVFESGENNKKKDSFCQERRGYRGIRRLERRRQYRKILLKNHFENIGLIPDTFNDDFAECFNDDVYKLKVKGLSEKLTVAELYKCLVHTCNHRGYKDFYEDADSDNKNTLAVNAFAEKYRNSGKESVSSYLLDSFMSGNFVNYRNRALNGNEYFLIDRSLLIEEAEAILKKQSDYYAQLTAKNVEIALNIIFSQRDFEDGPGDKNDSRRRYTGFLETLGACPFYKEEKRGFRNTIISDIFSVTNTISQYTIINKQTGELELSPKIAEIIVEYTLKNAGITNSSLKKLLQQNGYDVEISENSNENALEKSSKYIKEIKKSLESFDESWDEYISEDQFDFVHKSKLNIIGEILSTYQTPRRRVDELVKAGVNRNIAQALSIKKFSGTARTSYKYMVDSINAFLSGEIYGNFQTEFNKRLQGSDSQLRNKYKTLPFSVIDDEDIKDNPVVLKAVNETRKVVNEIIRNYGMPSQIVIETADELGMSFVKRDEVSRIQRNNEKNNDQIKINIVDILKPYRSETFSVTDVTQPMVDRYKLFKQQEGKSLYSGEPLGELVDVLLNQSKLFEIDHIVPYSLILDNTLANKALVFTRENQEKKNRVPLMYLTGETRDKYIAFAKYMYVRDNKSKKSKSQDYPQVSKKKLAYMLMSDIYSVEAQEKLADWKSRNINDTRYITRYVVSMLDSLDFGNDKKHVYGVKGQITSRFRRIWLYDNIWGKEEKNRDSFLNHSVDAVIIANLSPEYIEIASDAVKLLGIYRKYQESFTSYEYIQYLDQCKKKMEKYYGFNPQYTESLLKQPKRVPSFCKNINEEVSLRFDMDCSIDEYIEKQKSYYKNNKDYSLKTQFPLVSIKPNRKFKGTIADDNPIKIKRVDGESYKIYKKSIMDISKKDLDNLYTNDTKLVQKLKNILNNNDVKDISSYLKAEGKEFFTTDNGQRINKVSLKTKSSSFYHVEKSTGNSLNLGMPKYYCLDVYEDVNGKTRIYGVRFVDIVNLNGKLFQKRDSIPSDYNKHQHYIFSNDYIEVSTLKCSNNNTTEIKKFEGYYRSVKNINTGNFYVALANDSQNTICSIASHDVVKKIYINILGEKEGEIKCSEQLPLIPEKR